MLTQERLKELFDYRDGVLYWKVSPNNKARIGQIAGRIGSNGYWVIGIDYRVYQRSKLMWMLHYGQWPYPEVDHHDQDRTNDRIENLRLANRSEQTLNSKIRSDNTTGFKGVYWNARYKKWQAQIRVNNKSISLGNFERKIDAINARLAAEQKYYDEKFYKW